MINDQTSIAVVQTAFFAILVNKICKIVKIFEQLDHSRNQFVLCQH